MYRILSFLLASIFFMASAAPAAADATSFDPRNVTVQAKPMAAGIPVGTVISWPVTSNPADADKWLDCNGQAITAAAYPELFALVGANVPDYRGLFLRGQGGSSAALGVKQDDAGRNITGDFGVSSRWPGASGAFYESGRSGTSHSGGTDARITYAIDASRSWGSAHTSDEFRPVNTAVRYLIRAKP